MSEAVTVPCPRCGAVLPVDGSEERVRCSFCAGEASVDAQLLDRARRWRRQVDEKHHDEAQAMDVARRFDDGAQRWWDGSGGGRVGTRASEGATASAPCPSCGGLVTFRAGEASVRCPHCGASTMASTQVQSDISSALDRRVANASAARERAERRMIARGLDADEGPLRFYGWIAFGGLAFAGFGVLTLIDDHDPPGSSIVLFGLGGAAVVAAILGYFISTAKLRTIRRDLAALAARIGAAPPADGLRPILGWLDAHWTADNPDLVHMTDASGHCWSLSFGWRGRPALLVATEREPGRLDVFVAGRRGARVRDAETYLERLGFEILVRGDCAHTKHGGCDPTVLANGGLERILEATCGA